MASPCRGFVPAVPMAPGEYGPCARCDKVVHDLRRMSEREVIALLDRNAGDRICVAYRTRKDGSIVLRADTPPSRHGALALLLAAACAGHGPAATELEGCREADGTYVDCTRSGPSWGFTAVPEAVPPSAEVPVSDVEAEVEIAAAPEDEVADEIVPEGVQTELLPPEPEGEGCPPPWERGDDIVGVLVETEDTVGDIPVVGKIDSSRRTLRDHAVAREQRREARKLAREERRAQRQARRAAR